MIVLQATPPICFISFPLTPCAADGYISFHRFVNRRGFCALAAVPLMLPPSPSPPPSSPSTSPSTPWQGPCHFSLSLYSPFCAQWALHFCLNAKTKEKAKKKKTEKEERKKAGSNNYKEHELAAAGAALGLVLCCSSSSSLWFFCLLVFSISALLHFSQDDVGIVSSSSFQLYPFACRFTFVSFWDFVSFLSTLLLFGV